jgi:hypothetical protein
MSTPTSESSTNTPHPREEGQQSDGWYEGYYDPTFSRNPWANLHKADGLEPMGIWVRKVHHTPKITNPTTKTLHQSLECLYISHNDKTSPSFPLENPNPTPLTSRGADPIDTVPLPPISRAEIQSVSPDTAMEVGVGPEPEPEPEPGRGSVPVPVPEPEPESEIGSATTVPLTIPAPAPAPAPVTVSQTGKVARDRRRRQRKRETKRLKKQEEREVREARELGELREKELELEKEQEPEREQEKEQEQE